MSLRLAYVLAPLAQNDGFATSPNPFIALMVAGFAVGVFGYLYGSRLIVAVGIAMIFCAAMLIPLALNVFR